MQGTAVDGHKGKYSLFSDLLYFLVFICGAPLRPLTGRPDCCVVVCVTTPHEKSNNSRRRSCTDDDDDETEIDDHSKEG